MSQAEQRPLKILQVGSGFPGWGGTELHLINLAEQLTKRGHKVYVSARPEKYVWKEAKERGLPIFEATVERQWDFKEGGKIARFIKEERFDVVHVHWSTDYAVTPILARQVGVPVILMSRHSPYPLKSAIGRFLYDRVLFDRIIALSESVRRTLVGQGLRGDRVITLHHGTDTDAFRQTTLPPSTVRQDWGVPDDAFLVGLVGRIAPEKGYDVLMEAVAKSAPNVYGVLIGGGPDEAQAKERAAKPDLAGRLLFAGFRRDVNNAINALDALILASTWAEPCAAVVQQAMALSKPVIGTDIGGTPEMIARNKTGLLVPPSDADAMAQVIADLAAASPESRATMGEAGRERADALFTLKGMTDRIEALYYSLLSAKGR